MHKHSPLGDHEEVSVIDLGVSEVFVLGITSILNFLMEEKENKRAFSQETQRMILNSTNNDHFPSTFCHVFTNMLRRIV